MKPARGTFRTGLQSILQLGVASMVAACLHGCTSTAVYDCAEDPRPIELCADLHESAYDRTVVWTCTPRDCGFPAEFADGCSSQPYLDDLKQEIPLECLEPALETSVDMTLGATETGTATAEVGTGTSGNGEVSSSGVSSGTTTGGETSGESEASAGGTGDSGGDLSDSSMDDDSSDESTEESTSTEGGEVSESADGDESAAADEETTGDDGTGDAGETTGGDDASDGGDSAGDDSSNETVTSESGTESGTSGTGETGDSVGDTGEDSGDATSTEDSSSGEADTDQDCESHVDCEGDPAGDYCDTDSGECVPCTDDSHCDGRTALCGADNQCFEVECIDHSDCTSSARPRCDDNQECQPCNAVEGQCKQGAACNPFVGACLSEDQVLNVAYGDEACSELGPGTPTRPFCLPSQAFAFAKSADWDEVTIRVKSEGGVIVDTLEVAGFYSVGLIAEGNVSMSRADGESYSVQAFNDAQLFIDGLRFVDTIAGFKGGAGDPRAWINDSVFEQSNVGVSMDSGYVHLEDSIIRNNKYGGFSTTVDLAPQPPSVLHNVILANNGLVSETPASIRCTVSGRRSESNSEPDPEGFLDVVLDHVTVMDEPASCRKSCGIRITNSLMLGHENGFEGDCDRITVSYSAADDASLDGEGVELFDSVNRADWFVDHSNQDYRLLPLGTPALDQIADIAKNQGSSPRFDIEGVSRPPAGATDYPGADLPD